MSRGQGAATIRIAVVDDHPLIREGLASMVAKHSDLAICGSVGTAAEAVDMIRAERPDLAIIDIRPKDAGGLELIKRLRTMAPELKLLVSSTHDEALFAERALKAGALGFISKGEAIGQIVEAIRQVLSGEVYVSPRVSERLLDRGVSELSADPVESLSDRELEVFALIGEGQTTREIATRLDLSIKTVETHREHIKRKLGIESSTQLIRRAVEWAIESRREGS